MALLEVKDINVYYGVIQALKGISLEVNEGEIVALIGANGAGKSTTMQSIMGLIHPRSGEIYYNGVRIDKMPTHQIVKMGMTEVPEGRHIFQELTVIENIMLGAYTVKDREQKKKDLEKVFNLFPRLLERKNQIAGTLSGGEQQMLAISRALMSKPKLLLLDEPSMGLSPILVDEVFDIIKEIHNQGTTILLVEQNAEKALQIADKAYVLETGNITLTGTGKELRNNELVIKAYLGG
ncbi:MAG: ABC transporter ATP-binding protein [Bacilli bacterium]|nr:ABC transporter ATP-binding protein [Bacilli bacterium]